MQDAAPVVLWYRAAQAGLTRDDLRRMTLQTLLLYLECDEWAQSTDDDKRGGVNPFWA